MNSPGETQIPPPELLEAIANTELPRSARYAFEMRWQMENEIGDTIERCATEVSYDPAKDRDIVIKEGPGECTSSIRRAIREVRKTNDRPDGFLWNDDHAAHAPPYKVERRGDEIVITSRNVPTAKTPAGSRAVIAATTTIYTIDAKTRRLKSASATLSKPVQAAGIIRFDEMINIAAFKPIGELCCVFDQNNLIRGKVIGLNNTMRQTIEIRSVRKAP